MLKRTNLPSNHIHLHTPTDVSLPTYESHSKRKELEKFHPESINFDETHKLVEEWWENFGHNIHLDRWQNPDAKVRVILHHGFRTSGRQISLILGVPLLKASFEAIAINMPNYGMTKVAPGTTVSYEDWVNISDDVVNFELDYDPRPIVNGIIGMAFLEHANQQVRDESCRNFFMSRIGDPSVQLFVLVTLLRVVSIPFSLACKMRAFANDPAAMKIFMDDKTSTANLTSMLFTSSFMNCKRVIPPDEFTVCPILLTQPEKYLLTPLYLAGLFLKRFKKVDLRIVILENAGHYPLEESGLLQVHEAIISF